MRAGARAGVRQEQPDRKGDPRHEDQGLPLLRPGPGSGAAGERGPYRLGGPLGRPLESRGAERDFIIDIPADYKPDHPYRLFFFFHWYGGTEDSSRATLRDGPRRVSPAARGANIPKDANNPKRDKVGLFWARSAIRPIILV
jgi:hypothetical protein